MCLIINLCIEVKEHETYQFGFFIVLATTHIGFFIVLATTHMGFPTF